MININKLGNFISITTLFMFFLSVTLQNINYKPKQELNKIENKIEMCLKNRLNSLETLECIGKKF